MNQRQNANYQRQDMNLHRQRQRLKKKKQNLNIILSFCFIAAILIAFLVIFAVSGKDSDASAIPTAIPNLPTAAATEIPQEATQTPTIPVKTVLIDPGHGGFDVGKEGSDGKLNEDALNLAIALKVGNYLSQLGINPVFTRSDSSAVAPTKDEDMQRRVDIINSCGAVMAVSIHMNSYSEDSSVKGPEVYYYNEDPVLQQKSASIAASMQSALNTVTNGRRSSRSEDLMVLRESHIPAILIECGFLTNPTEETNLNTETYQDQLAQTIANCIIQNLP